MQKLPKAHIAITNRQSSHKKYYVEETPSVMKILRRLRDPDSYKR